MQDGTLLSHSAGSSTSLPFRIQRTQRGYRVRNYPAEPAECAGVTRSGAAEDRGGTSEAGQAVDYAWMRAQWCGDDISLGVGEPAVE